MPFLNVERELAFYKECLNFEAPDLRLSGRFMINLLSRIGEVKTDEEWRLSTSHLTLWFSSQYERDVMIEALPYWQPHLMKKQIENVTGFFNIEYRMRHENEPWPNARIKIAAKNVPEALAILEIAFHDCHQMYFIAPNKQ